MADPEIEKIHDQLLAVRDKPPGQTVKLEASQINHLCDRAKTIFLAQPALLELDGPINIVGAYFVLNNCLLA